MAEQGMRSKREMSDWNVCPQDPSVPGTTLAETKPKADERSRAVTEAEALRPLGPLSTTAVYIWQLVRSLARLVVRPRRRTAALVAKEYDKGRWQRLISQQRWRQATSLEAFLVGTDRRKFVAKVDGRVVAIRRDDYARLRLRRLHALFSALAGDTDALVELGCGSGRNLFSLALGGGWNDLRGFDISPNSIAGARAIAAYFGLEHLAFGDIDLKSLDHPNWSEVAGRVVFTCFCIEQIPDKVEQVVENILAAKPRRVIHIEPTTELLRPWKPLDLLNILHIRSKDFQQSLFTVLSRLAAAGRVNILAQQRLSFAPTISNDGFVIAWEPR